MAACPPAHEKLRSLPDLIDALEPRRRAGVRVVCTNGCFDLLHVGHVRSLEYAATLGDVLVVAVNDDASMRALKPARGPLVPAEERAEMLAALGCVDYVVLFAERTAERVVAALRPDVYVKGGDYTEEAIPEAAIVRAYGGRFALAPLVPEHSTTNLVGRIRSAQEGAS